MLFVPLKHKKDRESKEHGLGLYCVRPMDYLLLESMTGVKVDVGDV